MHWPISPRPNHLLHAAGIIAFSFVDWSLQRCAHVTRLYANDRQARLGQSAEQPLRQWPRFQSDPFEVIGSVLEHLQESVRIALNLRFADNPTCVIHNAQARQLDRYVQSSKMLHAALLLLMLEALTTVTSFHHQPEAQHPISSAIHKNAGRLPHLRARSVHRSATLSLVRQCPPDIPGIFDMPVLPGCVAPMAWTTNSTFTVPAFAKFSVTGT